MAKRKEEEGKKGEKRITDLENRMTTVKGIFLWLWSEEEGIKRSSRMYRRGTEERILDKIVFES